MAQLAIGLAGAVIGGFIGGPVGASVGWAIGSLVGGMLFPPPGQTIEGPRLKDLGVQSSADGAPLAKVYGTARLAGNVIWSTDIVETRNEEEIEAEGAKGGGGPSATQISYTYSVSLAIWMCEGPITGVRRIWADSKLIYSVAEGADPATFQVNTSRGLLRFYLGTETQTQDPLIAAIEGAANTPAYRGTAYFVAEGLQLADFANHIPNFEFEVVSDGPETYPMITHAVFSNLVGHIAVDPARLLAYLVEDHLTGSPSNVIYKWDLTTNVPTPFIVITDAVRTLIPEVNGLSYDSDENELYMWGGDSSSLTYAKYDMSTGALIATANLSPTGSNSGTSAEAVGTESKFFYSTKTRTFWGKGVGFSSGDVFAMEFDPASGSISCTPVSDTASGGGVDLDYAPLIDAAGDIWICGVDWMMRSSREPVIYESSPASMDNDTAFLWKARQEIWAPSAATQLTDGWVVFDLTTRTYKRSGDVFGSPDFSRSYTTAIENVDGNVWFYYQVNGSDIIGSLRDTSGNEVRSFNAGTAPDTPSRALYYVPGVVVIDGTIARLFYEYALAKAAWNLDEVVEDICTTAGIPLANVNASALASEEVRGYVRARPMSARSAIEPLALGYGFDGVESDGTLKFVIKGGASVVTLTEDDLGAHEYGNDEDTTIYTETRALETELPATLTIGYINQATDYGTGTAVARRLIGRAEQSNFVELAIVFTSEEATQVADRLMRQAWLERSRYSFPLAPKHVALDPTDVVTLPGPIRVRLTNTMLEVSGLIKAEGVGDDDGALISYAVGTTDEPTETITLGAGGLTVPIVIDGPLLYDSHSEEGVYLAAAAERSDWPGAMWYRSFDSGNTWTAVIPSSTSARIGRIISGSMSSDVTSGLWDVNSEITVRLTDASLSLSSASSLGAFYDGENAVALSSDGEVWEIAQFYTATDNGDDTYTLRNWLRGRRGTEYAMLAHAVGANFVMLESPEVQRTSVSLGSLGADIEWKAVTFKGMIANAPTLVETFEGIAMKPYAPVHVGGVKQANGNYNLLWDRRARKLGKWLNALAVPLDETTEEYEVDILDEDFTYVAHTETVTGATTLAVTSGQISGYFGSPSAIAIGVRVYQMSDRIGRGFVGQAVVGREVPTALRWDSTSKVNVIVSQNSFTVTRNVISVFGWIGTATYKKEGRWYWEFAVTAESSANNGDILVGITKRTSFSAVTHDTTNEKVARNSGTIPAGSGGFTFTAGDVVMVAWDATNGKMYFGKNGTWQNGADPSTDTAPQITYTPSASWRPVLVTDNGSSTWTGTVRFATGHSHTIPTRYVPINL